MRIALIGNYPPPYGGVSVHVAGLGRWLRALGVEVRVLDIGRGDHEGDGVSRARGPWRYARALAEVAAGGFLLHTHTNGANTKSWLVALAAARAHGPRGPRGLLTIHSGLSLAYLAGSPHRRALARVACAGYGRVVAVNRQIATALAEAGVAPDDIEVLPAYSPSLFEPGDPPPGFDAIREAHAPLYCAALSPGSTYGEDLLRSAFPVVRRELPGAGLALFGPGQEGPGPSGEGIHLLGELSHGSALAVMRSSEVFVRPTRADGDAVSVREALALGRSVVASATGYRPPGCLLFRTGDAAELALRMAEAGRLVQQSAAPGTGGGDPLEAVFQIYLALWGEAPRLRS